MQRFGPCRTYSGAGGPPSFRLDLAQLDVDGAVRSVSGARDAAGTRHYRGVLLLLPLCNTPLAQQ